MTRSLVRSVARLVGVCAALGLSALGNAGPNTPLQTPLFVSEAAPALNMLVMGRDHKLYYEAYNDASDLDGDGALDVGFKPEIDYYGYFNSEACYTYQSGRFEPTAAAVTIVREADNQSFPRACTSAWSGNFLNYLATSRMDALRKVLYGGFRRTDTTSETVLEAAFVPQDAHSWGKEYDPARDLFDIGNYAPLTTPTAGYRHLFAVTTLSNSGTPQLRVLNNTSFRIWNWVSKEGLVASDKCVTNAILCTSGGVSTEWTLVPEAQLSNLTITTWKDSVGSPGDRNAMDSLFAAHSDTTKCGSGSVAQIHKATDGNPFNGTNGCGNDNYHTLIKGTITIPSEGTYWFAVDGDDAVDVKIDGVMVAGWYGGHGASNSQNSLTSHSGSILLSAGTYEIEFRHEEGSGGDVWGLYWKPPFTGEASALTDYALRVLACPATADLREDNCKTYPNGGSAVYKPTGLLHDFGEDERMYFGLLTGSYAKNTAGGVLRSNMGSFTREVNAATGQFTAISDGIVATIDKLRISDFNYSGTGSYDNCGWIVDGPITSSSHLGKCAMWGNPIGEMMYEALRYFGGAAAGRSEYTYASGAKDSQSPLSLPAPTWKPPYIDEDEGGGGYLSCSKPVMTVLSDINPSYDFKLPGSHWNSLSSTGDPATLATLNVKTETTAIGVAEELVNKRFFIGESNDVSDGAPTAKTIADLATVRGLSPEEPTKQGTYYSAGVAKFGAENPIGGDNKVMSYMVALASPLPQIRLPVGDNTVTVVPFAKSVGEYGIGAFKPTNQIVDYYVIEMANTGSGDTDLTVNGGRPYAQFRINYEDVEQGADHDMDAIVLYTLAVTAAGQLEISLASEYAAGSIVQHMGYVISGTTADGVYLEVRDVDTSAGSSYPYELNTPAGQAAGWCATKTNAGCDKLPLTATRTFTASADGASILKDPLWYAAKYGMPGGATLTDEGDPTNYFLVTNATTLKSQLTKAFNDITQATSAITSPAVVPQVNSEGNGSDYSVYRTSYDVSTWSGDLIKEKYQPVVGQPGRLELARVWSASAKLPTVGTRTIKMANSTGNGLVDFTWDYLEARIHRGVNLQQALATDPANPGVVPAVDEDGELTDAAAAAAGQQRLDFVKGNNTSLRPRDSLLGDIINSSPVVVEGAQYLAYLAERIDGAAGAYKAFAATQDGRDGRVYVGGNDGMLHGFDTESGVETFAFVPSEVIRNLNLLSSPDYNEAGGLHHFFVDGTPIVRDVYFSGAWHTVLVGTLGAGGKSLFALDITNPNSIQLLWEFSAGDDLQGEETQSDVGYSYPIPTIARLHSGQWAVVTGNGYDSASGRAVLMLIDIATGELIKKLPTASTDTDNGLSSVRVADNNSDGVADYVYAGDLKGNLWRFDLVDSAREEPLAYTPDTPVGTGAFKVSFSGDPLYVARDGTAETAKVQPITAPPSLVRHPSYVGYIVMFGTGRYFTLADKLTVDDLQTLYGIWDRQTIGEAAATTPELSRSDLQVQTFTDEVTHTFAGIDVIGADGEIVFDAPNHDETIRLLSKNAIAWYPPDAAEGEGTGKYGWYIDLKVGDDVAGERMVDEMFARGQVLFFTTRSPNDDLCQVGLAGWEYFIDPYTGGRTTFNVLDLNRDGVVDALDSYGDSYQPVSGRASPVGGRTLKDGKWFDPAGIPLTVSLGRLSSGRQSWQRVPDDATTTTPATGTEEDENADDGL